ncbi:putative polysaccharide biosynthesis protein [Hazenella coriacea]|uniref:PST family polysaccharide transporter n=1 Tax=Hazenella coriacea TaxID=1179467 RepID=A0A4R3L629_9BACL|nr:polysaccharide biosynthesis protein [Hazenella coriacea]TCS94290.1 PST family polysaccharide transporter [Hazenella coriacea]
MAQDQQTFVKGTVILGIAALITKILGAVYRIPYQNITGDDGMYVYQQVYPLYSTLLILATAGFPIAISKLVSEKVAANQVQAARKIFRVSSVMLFFTGFIFFLLLFFGAGSIAGWMGKPELLTLPIQSVSFAFLIVPMLAAFRGYFQGYQNMIPTATSQVVEQLIRVTTILISAWYFMEFGYGVVYAGAGAIFGAVTGAVGSFIILLYFRMKQRSSLQLQTTTEDFEPVEHTGKIISQLIAVSLPICLGALTLPLFSLVDSFTVANLLEQWGWGSEAISLKGAYDRGQPLIQFAAFFATAISLSIVPAIAEAKAQQREKEADDRATLAIRFTYIVGVPASIGLAVVALPTNVMLFKDATGSEALMLLAFTTLFSTLGAVSTGILQGAGRLYLPAWNLLIGVLVKLGLNLWLIPIWDIRGAAIATVAAYAVATILNLFALLKVVNLSITLREIGRICIAVVWMAIVTFASVWLIQKMTVPFLSYRPAMAVTSLVSVAVGGIIYFWSLFYLGILTREDIEKVPKLQAKLLPILEKWRLLRS